MRVLSPIIIVLTLSHYVVYVSCTPTTIRQKAQNASAPLTNATLANIPPSKQNKVVSEGGIALSTSKGHLGREHVLEPPQIQPVIIANNSSDIRPVHEHSDLPDIIVPQKHDHEKFSVPKKGVSFPASDFLLSKLSNSTTNSISLPKAGIVSNSISNGTNNNVPKKPLITEADNGDSADSGASKADMSKDNSISIDQIDPTLANIKNRSDYIVPIVAVILSVPLVAILISLVYKRCSDWWQHRNYKRMDFLIEGIYHN